MCLFVCLTGCQTKIVPQGPWVKKIDSEEFSRLVINFSARMKKDHRVELEDSRIAYDDEVKKIYLEYSSQRLLTVYEARLLMVEIVEEFLNRLNNHTVLSFQLERFPFSADDLDVKINFESFFGLYVDPLYVGQAWLKCGCVYFYAFDRKDLWLDWDHHRFEPYFKSRELALIKKIADLPDEGKENPPRKPNSFIYDRYTPSKP